MNELHLQSRDGTKLFARHYAASGPSKGKVLVNHGYGDHSGRYVGLLSALADAGFDALAYDMRGHGRSEGSRALILSFDEYVDDCRAAHHALGGGAPVVVFGHSVGADVVTHFVARDTSAARTLILGSPYFGNALKVHPLKLALGHAVGRFLPKLALATGLTGAHASHDPNEIALYDSDPLMNKNATTGWFVANEKAMAEAPSLLARITVPLLVYHGEMDEVASFATAKAAFDRAGSKEKRFLPLPGMRHEPLHEIERARVVKDIVEWAVGHA
jgi:lysophospholipase